MNRGEAFSGAADARKGVWVEGMRVDVVRGVALGASSFIESDDSPLRSGSESVIDVVEKLKFCSEITGWGCKVRVAKIISLVVSLTSVVTNEDGER